MVATDPVDEMTQDGAVGIPAAAEFLGVSRSELYDLMAASELRFLKIGRRRLLLKAELRRFLSDRLQAK